MAADACYVRCNEWKSTKVNRCGSLLWLSRLGTLLQTIRYCLTMPSYSFLIYFNSKHAPTPTNQKTHSTLITAFSFFTRREWFAAESMCTSLVLYFFSLPAQAMKVAEPPLAVEFDATCCSRKVFHVLTLKPYGVSLWNWLKWKQHS